MARLASVIVFLPKNKNICVTFEWSDSRLWLYFFQIRKAFVLLLNGQAGFCDWKQKRTGRIGSFAEEYTQV